MPKFISLHRHAHVLGLMLVLAGCAVQQTATQIVPLAAEQEAQQRTLAQALELQLDTGYKRSLKQGSRWTHIGRVQQGEVYKPYQDVFTLEGAHVHEAYLVVDNGVLVGFYLPAERAYSPLGQRPSITLQ